MSKPKPAKVKATVAPRPQASRANAPARQVELIFNKKNYVLLAAAAALMLLGILLMGGGAMPDPNTWDDSIIYSARRVTLAPLLMVAGMVVGVYAIFKK
jgi:hypothetical protein